MAVLEFGGLATHDQVNSTGEPALENPIYGGPAVGKDWNRDRQRSQPQPILALTP